MFQPETGAQKQNFDQIVWVQDIIQTIRPWVPDKTEASQIATWVYRYSQRFRHSPELILAMIAVESDFDHFAISNANARGLMQVMPFWKKEMGRAGDNLLEIKTNIRYGCAILRIYRNRYKKLDRALAAFNGSLGGRKYPDKVFAMLKKIKASRLDI